MKDKWRVELETYNRQLVKESEELKARLAEIDGIVYKMRLMLDEDISPSFLAELNVINDTKDTAKSPISLSLEEIYKKSTT